MPEEKPIAPQEPNSAAAGKDHDRRAFFVKLGLGSLSIAAAGTVAFAYQFLSPNVLYEPSPIVNAGKPENYAVDSVTLGRELRNLSYSFPGRLLCAERHLYPPRLHDCVET